MKKILTVALAVALVLGFAGTGMAAVLEDSELEVAEVETPELEEPEEEEAEEEEAEIEEPEVDDGMSQGTIQCALVIDYTVPGVDATGTGGSGTIILTAARGEQVETFTAEIPWGLTDEEAIAYITSTFGPLIEEKFGLEVNSFKVSDIAFDQETSVTTATFKAIHGRAPTRLMPPGLEKKAAGHTEMLRYTERQGECRTVKAEVKAAVKARGK